MIKIKHNNKSRGQIEYDNEPQFQELFEKLCFRKVIFGRDGRNMEVRCPISPIGSFLSGIALDLKLLEPEIDIEQNFLNIHFPFFGNDVDTLIGPLNTKYDYRPYQRDAIINASKIGRGIIDSPTASGKSLIIYGIIRNLTQLQNDRVLIVVPNPGLVTQLINDFNNYKGIDDIAAWRKGSDPIPDAKIVFVSRTIIKAATLKHIQEANFNHLIMDECIRRGQFIMTDTGYKKIEDVNTGDNVLSYNIDKNVNEFKPVLKKHKNLIKSNSYDHFLKITLENGHTIEVTPNHKIYTSNRGYVRADELTHLDDLVINKSMNLYDKYSYKENNMLCQICNKPLIKNHLKTHNITSKDYYDKYLLKDNENICHNINGCTNKTKFISLSEGYRRYCCRSCANTKNKSIDVPTLNTLDIDRKLLKSYIKTYCLSKRNTVNKYTSNKLVPFIDNIKNLIPNCKSNNIVELCNWIINDRFNYDICPICNDYIVEFKSWNAPYNVTCSKKCKHKYHTELMRTSVMKDIQRRNRLNFCKSDKGKDVLRKMADARRGINNPVHRRTDESIMRIKEKQSDTMKRKIASGEFTPCITNSWANSRCGIKVDGFIKYYRSTWDAAFQILNPNCEYEKIRIPYISPIDEEAHTYIVDFVDEENKILYEIKPNSNKNSKIVKIKELAAIEWCKIHNYEFCFISDEYFMIHAKNINYVNQDEKIYNGMKQFL